MKTQITFTKIILITGLIFTTFAAISGTTTPSATAVPSETAKTIRNYFKFPQVLMPQYETRVHRDNAVEVLFTTDKNGKVTFVLAKTADLELKKEIERQFSALQLTRAKQNVVHSVVLNFKTL